MASEEDLRQCYIGKDVGDVPKPAAVVDAAIVRRHCKNMLHATRTLGVGLRVHVKSHKVIELFTKLK
jgi:D-serine ammonia-lyase